MATVTGYTAAKILEMFNDDVISGTVVGDNLILTKRGGGTIDAGNVRGATGATGPTGDVSTADLAAAVADIRDNAGLGILQVVQEDVEQFIPGFSADTWKDVTGLTWANTYTADRYVEVSFQVALQTQDPDGSDFDVRILRVGGAEVCSASGSVRRADHPIVVHGARKFLVPGTWAGSQTLKMQVRYSTDYNVYVKNATTIGSLSFTDVGAL